MSTMSSAQIVSATMFSNKNGQGLMGLSGLGGNNGYGQGHHVRLAVLHSHSTAFGTLFGHSFSFDFRNIEVQVQDSSFVTSGSYGYRGPPGWASAAPLFGWCHR